MANVLEIILSGNTKELDASLSKTEKNLRDFGKKMQSIGKDMSLYLTTPLLALGGASIKFASDFNESLNKVDVAFKESSQEVKDFGKTTLKTFGIAEGTALDMAALFGDMSTSMGLSTSEASKLSTSLVGLAGDLASFKNMNIEEVTTALNGVFTGETESLKRLGVVMTEVNLKQFAMEKGIKTQIKDMTQAEKVMLRYEYVMSKTANAHGDFARTGGGAANQTRMFTEGLKQLGQQFGEILLPTFTEIVKKLNSLITSFGELDKGTKVLIITLSGLVALSGPLLYLAGTVIPAMVTGFGLLRTAAISLNTALGGLSAFTGLITLLGTATIATIKLTNSMSEKTGLTYEEVKSKEALEETIKTLEEKIKKQKQLDAQFGNSEIAVTGLNTAQTQLKGSYKRTIEELEQNLTAAKNQLFHSNLMTKSKELENKQIDLQNKFLNTNSEEVVVNVEALKQRRDELEKTAQIIREQVKEERELAKARYDMLTTSLEAPQISEVSLATTGINPEQVVTNQITKALEDRKTAMQKAYQDILPIANGIQGVFNQMGEGIIQSLNITGTAFGNFISGMASFLIEYAGMAIKQLLIDKAVATSTATTGAVKTASASGPAFAVVLPAILAGVLGVVGSAFKKIPKFADGGIVSGPTMAMVGEYSGAKRNPEVIAPLDRLQSMIGGAGGNVNVTGEFVVRGQDLVLALQRADQFKNRIS